MKNNVSFVITGAENIERVRLFALRHALKLETFGLRRRGKSARALVCEALNLPPRTSATKALAAMNAHLGE